MRSALHFAVVPWTTVRLFSREYAAYVGEHGTTLIPKDSFAQIAANRRRVLRAAGADESAAAAVRAAHVRYDEATNAAAVARVLADARQRGAKIA